MKYSFFLFILLLHSLVCFAQTQLLPVRVNGKWGAIDLNGKLIIPTDYQFISKFNSLGLAIAQKEKKLGLINQKGEIILPFEYLNLQFLGDSLLAFYPKNTWGLKNYRGETLLPAEFDNFKIFKKDSSANSPRFIIAQKGTKIGVISTQAKILYSPDLDEINFLSNQLIISRKAKLFGLKTLQGEEILPLICENISLKPYGILVKKSGKWGLLNEKGEILIPFDFEQIIYQKKEYPKKNEYFEVQNQGKKGVFSMQGKQVIPAQFGQVEDLEENYSLAQKFWRVRQGNLKGIYNNEGKIILIPDNEEVIPSGKRYFIFQKNGLWGVFAWENEKIIVSSKYQSIKALEAQNLNQDYFIVQTNFNEFSVVDIGGREVMKSGEYDEIQFDEAGVFLVRQENKWGIAGKNHFLSPQFDQISQFNRNLALVRNDKLLGLINIYGQVLAGTYYQKIKMSGNTAKLFLADNSLEYLTFNSDGTLLDQLKINQLRTLSIKKAKAKPEENKPKDDWDFSFRKAAKDSLDKQKRFQITELNSQANNPIPAGKFTWFFEVKSQKWGLKNQQDSVLIKPTYRSITVFPKLNLSKIVITQKTINTKRDTVLVSSYGLINNDLAKIILAPQKISELEFEAILIDFQQGNYARMNNYFFTKEGKILNHLSFPDKNPKAHLKPITFAENFNAKGFSRVNILGGFKPSFAGEPMSAPLIRGGYWGLVNRKGENIVKAQYQGIMYLGKSSFSKIQKNALWGVVDSIGKEIIPPQYHQVDFLENTQQQYFLISRQQTRYGYIDTTGFISIDLKFRQVRPFVEGFGAVQDTNQLWTYLDTKGNRIHSPDFQMIRDFSEGFGAVKLKQHWGFLNERGEIAILAEYKQVGDFHCGRAWSLQHGKYGFISKSGTYIIPPKFEKVSDFQQNVAVVREFGTDNRYGLIDTLGNWLIKPSFYKIETFNNQGYALTRASAEKMEFGLIHSSGKEISKPHYQAIEDFIDGWAIVQIADKQAFMDTTGKHLANRTFEKVLPFSENLAGVKLAGKWGFIDNAGKTVIEAQFSQVSSFFNGIAQVVEGSKYYYINSEGKKTDAPHDSLDWRKLEDFSEIKPISNGLFAFKKNDLWGFKNEADEVVIYPHYQQVSPFYNGYAKARFFKNIFYLNKQGKSFKKLPNNVQWIDLEKPHFQIVKQNDKYGFASPHGFRLSNPKFTYLGEMQENRSSVAINEWLGIADLQGNIILSPDYEQINYLGEGIFRLEKNDAIGYWHKEKGWIWKLAK